MESFILQLLKEKKVVDEKPSPVLSIVVPVKNNGSTIKSTLINVLNAIDESCELIVLDNASTDNSAQVYNELKGYKNLIIKSFSKPVSMSKNWERGLDVYSGDFITVIGGDDGFYDKGLKALLNILKNCNPKVPISWGKIGYRWPFYDKISKNGSFRFRSMARTKNTKLSSALVLKKILNRLDREYLVLPSIYNSAIPRSIIDDIRKSDGIFFNAQTPDVYSGLRVCLEVNEYTFLPFPVGISGVSTQSNGVATFSLSENPIASDFNRHNKEDGNDFAVWLPPYHCLATCIVDTYEKLQTRSKKNKDIIFPKVNGSRFLREIVKHFDVNDVHKSMYFPKIKEMLKTLQNDKRALNIFKINPDYEVNQINLVPPRNKLIKSIYIQIRRSLGNKLMIAASAKFNSIDVAANSLKKPFYFNDKLVELWVKTKKRDLHFANKLIGALLKKSTLVSFIIVCIIFKRYK